MRGDPDGGPAGERAVWPAVTGDAVRCWHHGGRSSKPRVPGGRVSTEPVLELFCAGFNVLLDSGRPLVLGQTVDISGTWTVTSSTSRGVGCKWGGRLDPVSITIARGPVPDVDVRPVGSKFGRGSKVSARRRGFDV